MRPIITMHRKLIKSVRLAIRQRLILFLEEEQRNAKWWKENISHKLPPSKQAIIARNYKKRIQALRIVIWMLTPREMREEDIPNLF